MSYVARKSGAAIGAACAVVLAVALVSIWPWLLGTHVALKEGARKGSTGYDLAGWLPEIAWIALLVGCALVIVRKPRR